MKNLNVMLGVISFNLQTVHIFQRFRIHIVKNFLQFDIRKFKYSYN